MKTVRAILQAKGHDVWAIGPDASVYEALQLMADKSIGAVVVIDAGGELVGVMSERDYAREIILKDKASKDTRVRDIMSKRVVCVHPDQTTQECMRLMTDKHIRHLPVLDSHRLVGMVSIGDVVKAIIADQACTITQLRDYASGDDYPVNGRCL